MIKFSRKIFPHESLIESNTLQLFDFYLCTFILYSLLNRKIFFIRFFVGPFYLENLEKCGRVPFVCDIVVCRNILLRYKTLFILHILDCISKVHICNIETKEKNTNCRAYYRIHQSNLKTIRKTFF